MTLDRAAKGIEAIRAALLFNGEQDNIDATPFAAALLLQALGALEQARGLLIQAEMMRARESAGNF